MPPEDSLPLQLPPPLPPRALPPPRVWSALVVPVIGMVAALVVAGCVQTAIMFADKDFQKSMAATAKPILQVPPTEKNGNAAAQNVRLQIPDFSALAMAAMNRFVTQPYGVAVIVIPGQVVLAAAALGAAALSPRRMRDRLGYVRSALPWWTLPVLIVATNFFGMLGGLFVDRFIPGRHEVLEFFATMAKSGAGSIVVLNIALLSLLPGLIEESLFRGYVQRRLLERWTPLAAIAASSALFCAAHFDPVHVIGVVPVGIWFGVLAWRCGTVWPGMLCHASMNAVSFTMMRLDPNPDDHSILPAMWVALLIGAASVGLAIFLMRRYPPGQLAAAPAAA